MKAEIIYTKEDFDAAYGRKLTEEEYKNLKNVRYDIKVDEETLMKYLKTKNGLLTVVCKLERLLTKSQQDYQSKKYDFNDVLELLKRSGSTGCAFSKLMDDREEITKDDRREIIEGILTI